MQEFLFGASLSAHQVEGNNKSSDWWKFEQKVLKKKHLQSGKATNHYHLYEEDFNLASEIGHNSHRLSIEWAKIEPKKGKIDFGVIEHYKKVLQYLISKNITPVVTLFHISLPDWYHKEGCFMTHKGCQLFIEYSKFIVNELQEYLEYIITINEPIVYCANSYLTGKWPPQIKKYSTYRKVLYNLVSTHNQLYKELKKQHPHLQISIAKNNLFFEPEKKHSLRDKILTKYLEYSWNHKFLDMVKHNLDYIGLNYYFVKKINAGKTVLKDYYKHPYYTTRITDLNWEIYPKGIYFILKHLYKRYNLPILITENGVADNKDNLRATTIKETLKWVFEAKKEGVNVIGYLHWALTDNFEWTDGFTPRFGLIKIDYNNYSRSIRPSALEYKHLIEQYTKEMTTS